MQKLRVVAKPLHWEYGRVSPSRVQTSRRGSTLSATNERPTFHFHPGVLFRSMCPSETVIRDTSKLLLFFDPHFMRTEAFSRVEVLALTPVPWRGKFCFQRIEKNHGTPSKSVQKRQNRTRNSGKISFRDKLSTNQTIGKEGPILL